jgi:hypothetical protein
MTDPAAQVQCNGNHSHLVKLEGPLHLSGDHYQCQDCQTILALRGSFVAIAINGRYGLKVREATQ